MRLLALFLVLWLIPGCARPVPDRVTVLTYATPYSPSHPFSRADLRWIEHVERESGGTLRIRPIWSGGLLSAEMSMEELRHGVADIGLITPIYVRGGTHLIRMQSGFYSGADSIESQVELYRCLERSTPQIASELHGLKVLAVQGGLIPGIVTRARPVRSLADLKGMRLRAPTELLRVLEQLGVDPVNMPMGDVYSAMSKGVIDGVVAPPDTFAALHFAEIAHYYADLAVPRGAYPARAMGLDAWNRLTPAQQSVLEDAVPVWEAALAEENRTAAERGLAEASKSGVVVSRISPEDQASFDRLYLENARINAEALDAFGIDGLTAFRRARASVTARNRIECRMAT
jgi:TRAP-type C4-dicarboxylate transport system substrate-binding protein